MALLALTMIALSSLAFAQNTTPATGQGAAAYTETQKNAPPIGPAVKPGTLEPAGSGNGATTSAEASATTEPSTAAPTETKAPPTTATATPNGAGKPGSKNGPKMAYTGADLPLLYAVSAILIAAGVLVIVVTRRACRRPV